MNKTDRRFHIKDMSEIVMGSAILAFPVAMTEEAWNLGKDLPGLSIIIIVVLSLVFIAWYGYHAHYQSSLDTHRKEWLLRIVTTYAITLVVAAGILAILSQFPLWSEPAVAIKRMIIVAAPASSAATVVDSLR